MTISILLLKSTAAFAQSPDNVTLNQTVAGDYRGYVISPYYFYGSSGYPLATAGYVAAGNKTDLISGAHDSVNVVLIPDGNSPLIASFNLGISGATDLRAVGINETVYDATYNCDLFYLTLQARGGRPNPQLY